jgi:hypothetical protein
MEKKSDASKSAKKPANSRDDRLKAALKANLSRRKQLARARSKAEASEQTDTTK